MNSDKHRKIHWKVSSENNRYEEGNLFKCITIKFSTFMKFKLNQSRTVNDQEDVVYQHYEI